MALTTREKKLAVLVLAHEAVIDALTLEYGNPEVRASMKARSITLAKSLRGTFTPEEVQELVELGKLIPKHRK